MRAAFKEWAVVVDALGRGIQTVILRKGGISEGPGGFQVAHNRFLLFPTLFHQQRDSVIESAQARYDELAPGFPPPDRVRLEYFAEIAAAWKLRSPGEAEGLRGQHVWRDEIIAGRFVWGGEKTIFALAVRVFQLPQALELPLLPAYGGCRSWIEMESDVRIAGARPVLTEAAFANALANLESALPGPGRIAADQGLASLP